MCGAHRTMERRRRRRHPSRKRPPLAGLFSRRSGEADGTDPVSREKSTASPRVALAIQLNTAKGFSMNFHGFNHVGSSCSFSHVPYKSTGTMTFLAREKKKEFDNTV